MDPQNNFESILSFFLPLTAWGDFFFKFDSFPGENAGIPLHIYFSS